MEKAATPPVQEQKKTAPAQPQQAQAKTEAPAKGAGNKKPKLFEHPGEDAPVLPTINDSMKFDLIINDKKKSMLIVDKPFAEVLY